MPRWGGQDLAPREGPSRGPLSRWIIGASGRLLNRSIRLDGPV